MAIFGNSTRSSHNSSSLSIKEMSTAPSFIFIFKYYASLIRICVLHPLGIMGSVMTLLVASRTALGSQNFSFYMRVLAITDGLRLAFTFINILPVIFVLTKPGWYCKMTYFMGYFTSVLSDLTVTILTVERAVAVVVPHKVKLIFTLKRTLTVLLLVVIFDFLINIHVILTIDSNGVTNGIAGCATVVDYLSISQIFNAIIMVLFVVAFLVNFVCAILIIFKLRQRRMLMAGALSGGINYDTQITTMLLSILLLYLICTLPLMTTFFYTFFVLKRGQGLFVRKSNVIIALTQIGTMLKDLSHVGNFYAYCLSANMFRKGVKDLIGSCRPTCGICKPSD